MLLLESRYTGIPKRTLQSSYGFCDGTYLTQCSVYDVRLSLSVLTETPQAISTTRQFTYWLETKHMMAAEKRIYCRGLLKQYLYGGAVGINLMVQKLARNQFTYARH
jgi:hypothetical protein